MILSTHANFGGTIASLFPSEPLFAVVAGFASHFAIDAIPHWDYPLRSISVGKGADNRRLNLSRWGREFDPLTAHHGYGH
jgi:hypothetical protein